MVASQKEKREGKTNRESVNEKRRRRSKEKNNIVGFVYLAIVLLNYTTSNGYLD